VRRRAVVALASALVAWLVVANNVDLHANAPVADWARPRVVRTSTGITAFYPRAWRAQVGNGTLVISSSADARLPRGGVYIWLANYGRMPRTNGFAARPRHFDLWDAGRGFQSCGFGFEGWNLTFVDHGQTVQAIVGLGSGARKSDATAVLDKLVIRPAA
jgi:hypothetical protein